MDVLDAWIASFAEDASSPDVLRRLLALVVAPQDQAATVASDSQLGRTEIAIQGSFHLSHLTHTQGIIRAANQARDAMLPDLHRRNLPHRPHRRRIHYP